MPVTYQKIASTELSSSAASITFSSIPATYTDLLILASVRTASSSVSTEITFNGDTATNYSDTAFFNSSGSATSSRRSNVSRILVIGMDNSTTTANTFSNSEIYIPSYRINAQKQIYTNAQREELIATQTTGNSVGSGYWRNTAVINSITLTGNGGSYATGSSFYLYGISNS